MAKIVMLDNITVAVEMLNGDTRVFGIEELIYKGKVGDHVDIVMENGREIIKKSTRKKIEKPCPLEDVAVSKNTTAHKDVSDATNTPTEAGPIIEQVDKSNWLFNVLTLFYPIVGVVIYLAIKKQSPIKASSVLKFTFAGFALSILSAIFSSAILSLLF